MRRDDLRATFDSSAAAYHGARPRYPVELFDALDEYAGAASAAEVLEIGPGTGIATIPLAERGHRVTAIEIGERLSARARANTAGLGGVSIVHGSFDDWEPSRWGMFDRVVAATAWHWLDPATKYVRAHRHLRPLGTLAFWSALHVVPDDGDTFFADIQPVYDEIGESLPADHTFPRPGELADHTDEIVASGLFNQVHVRHFDWAISYDADGYIALLETFSGHISMDRWKRDRLYGEIRQRLDRRPDRRLRRHWGAALHLARRMP
ncbi:MAG: class I SAM-dependent methyltransferase [Ilumatobacter sp.]|uniref:class I SAM-dependent methyltransferase n=1 Tax=Ilumatobacter sp. TaxID=1967498 RepID=UPI002613E140|nr:class I SAM-dependent methyltransferase [Ilumatobacter sp.]MDJ0768428.1 class I SAM-dependent methyltransferase [Ilumatobacter sp.]